ncbi:hypothetical protein [Paralimibaculum aggregatum]|uniref:hypothetical protein n=1 Tax=Paralimibaculum aggregatum TaxID=3036245 RepID=UPI00255612EA|nr:hypothetical protein [Limibaculum sp. NKW23]
MTGRTHAAARQPRGMTVLAGLLALGLAACTDPDFYDTGVPVTSGTKAEEEVPLGALTAAEVRLYLRDSTLIHRTDDETWSIYVSEDGSLRGIVETNAAESASTQASGSWEVTEDGLFCRQWSGRWDPDDTGCASITRTGEVYAFTPVEPGGRAYRRLRKPGNTKGL